MTGSTFAPSYPHADDAIVVIDSRLQIPSPAMGAKEASTRLQAELDVVSTTTPAPGLAVGAGVPGLVARASLQGPAAARARQGVHERRRRHAVGEGSLAETWDTNG